MGMEIMKMTEHEKFLINANDRIGAKVIEPWMSLFGEMYKLGLVGGTGCMTRIGQIVRQRAMRRLEDKAFDA